jgi:hypothetical protein
MKGKSLSVIGTAITLAFTSNVAMAQSSESMLAETDSSTGSPAEIKMSPEGMKILCERFPLNSRCPNGIPLDRGFSRPAPAPESNSVESSGENNNLDTTTVPVTPTIPTPENSPENSTELTPVPDMSSPVESNQGENTNPGEGSTQELPSGILPQVAPSGT